KQFDIDGHFEYSPTVSVQRVRNDEVIVYPNPTSDRISIRLGNGVAGPVHVKLMDVTGRILDEFDVQIQEQGTQMSIPVTGLSNGTYLLSIDTDGRASIHSFVKN